MDEETQETNNVIGAGHCFGNPNAPLLGEEKPLASGNDLKGAKKKRWQSSALFLLEPFRERNNWDTEEFVARVISAVSRMSDRFPQLDEVVKVWDKFQPAKRKSLFSIDDAIEQSSITRDEFAGLALAALKMELSVRAEAMQMLALPDLVRASLNFSEGFTEQASKERVKHLEKHRILDAPKPSQINVQATATGAPRLPPKTFDSQLAELDAIDADYEDLPAGKPPKEIGDGK